MSRAAAARCSCTRRDRDGLFAAITATLDRAAPVGRRRARRSSAHGMAFDTFVVLDAETQAPLDAARAAELEARARRSALRRRAMSRARRAPQPAAAPAPFPARAARRIHDDGIDATQLALVCGDQPGLLAQVAQTLRDARVRVHDARIATFGERAEDFFVITDETIGRCRDEAQQALRAALEQRFGVDEVGDGGCGFGGT